MFNLPIGRSFVVLVLSAVFLSQSWAHCQTQPTPGINVNLISGTSWPGGDPFAQRQNEPSGAGSTLNPLRLLAAANDYSPVDLPFVLGSEENGDAWIGLFQSFDGGLSWTKSLLQGCPYNIAACNDPRAAAIKGFQAAADPTVRAGSNGLFYLSGIVFNRGENAPGAVFVATFHDGNNRERADSINLQRIAVVDTGNSGQFLDKPWMDVDEFRGKPGTAPCTVSSYNEGKPFDVGNAYLVYSKFVGSDVNNPHSQIMIVKSSSCGQTWSKPSKLSESNSVNQGTTVAVNPLNGDVYVAWRRIQNPNASESNAILFVKSTNGGNTYSKAVVAAEIDPFDQGTSEVSFRTRALPTMAVDGNGNIYIAWAEREPPDETGTRRARIRMIVSTDGGNSWNPPFWVEDPQPPIDYVSNPDNPLVDTNDGWPLTKGHHFMPSLSFSNGKLALLYYDLREDHTKGVYYSGDYFPGTGGGVFQELRARASTVAPEQVFTDFIADSGSYRRHTLDVRVVQADVSATAASSPSDFGPSVRVSSYKFGTREGSDLIQQLQFNPPNFPMFNLGTWPFIGDYIEIFAEQRFLKTTTQDGETRWVFNNQTDRSPVFHALWTDNRNVRPPANGDWADWVPPVSVYSQSIGDRSQYDPNEMRELCIESRAGQTGMRNQDIYTSRIPQGLVVGTLGNTKPLLKPDSSSIQRGYVVFVQNNKNKKTTYTLTIDPPSVGEASFIQVYASGSPLLELTVDVPARSTVARTVFVTADVKFVPVTVNVVEVTSGKPLSDSIVLNADIANADIVNADIANADIANYEVYNADIANADIANADIANALVVTRTVSNADIVNADIANADIANADIANADIVNADIVNADIANADIANADIANADIANADIVNADIANADIANTPFTDVTWSIKNAGNTSASYNIKLLLKQAGSVPTGAKLQLLLHKTYTSPITWTIGGGDSCKLNEQVQNQLVASIPYKSESLITDPANLAYQDADIVNADIANATLALPPGETGEITLRIVGGDRTQLQEFLDVLRATATSQGRNSDGTRVPLALIITTYTLGPPVNYGSYFSQTVLYEGGTGRAVMWEDLGGDPTRPDIHTLSSAGLNIDPVSGLISGTPTEAGNFKFRIKASEVGAFSDPDDPRNNLAPQSDIQILTASILAASQTITFAPLPDRTYGDPPFSLAATASSGLPVIYEASGACAVSGSLVTITGSGSCTITALQPGGTNYGPAPAVSRAFLIGKAATNTLITAISPDPSGVGETVTVSFTVTSAAGVPTGEVKVSAGSATCAGNLTSSGAGSCTLVFGTAGDNTIAAEYLGDFNFAGSSTSATHTVLKKFTFIGFLPPNAIAGTVENPSYSGVANLGSNVTLKWRLQDASGSIIDDQVPKTTLSASFNNRCSGMATGAESELWPTPQGATELRIGDNQYVFNWDTSGVKKKGCYNIVVTLSDGAKYSTIIELK